MEAAGDHHDLAEFLDLVGDPLDGGLERPFLLPDRLRVRLGFGLFRFRDPVGLLSLSALDQPLPACVPIPAGVCGLHQPAEPDGFLPRRQAARTHPAIEPAE